MLIHRHTAVKSFPLLTVIAAMFFSIAACDTKKESDDSNLNTLMLLNALPKVCSTNVSNPTVILTEIPIDYQYTGSSTGYCYFRHSPSSTESFGYDLISWNSDSNIAMGAQNDVDGGTGTPSNCTGWEQCSSLPGTGSSIIDNASGITALGNFRIIGVYAQPGARFTLEATY
ncbi:MAG: hypothetical protein KA369_11315 [Spirochaetes bacterium]|nr:hypothetical protein [Spirochaetota bacterium]